ncbi:MAG: polyribonucleotide nucleotidyltransferase [Chloroflexi bacterium]|nr:polyribonucleotide nucleotidyltransferase [Chloroflexota bacterium]
MVGTDPTPAASQHGPGPSTSGSSRIAPGNPIGRVVRKEITFAGRQLIIETGKLAGQAGGSVTVQFGQSIVLATATMSRSPRDGIDFLPLTVDYEERLYAAGKIPGSYQRREGRARDAAILSGRLVDRPIRPLFPKGLRHDVQVIITTLSTDQENDPSVLGIVGASAALMISDIPWGGPIGGVRMGYVDGHLVVNPTQSQLAKSTLDLMIAATPDAVMMVEAGANRVSERVVLDAIAQAHAEIRALCVMQEELRAEIGKAKREFTPSETPAEVKAAVDEALAGRLHAVLYQADKSTREVGLDALTADVVASLKDRFDAGVVVSVVESRIKTAVRDQILTANIRPDGRDTKTIRAIVCEVGVLPRTHGSALFTRGQTQALSIATLGSPGDAQRIDSLEWQDEVKRYMHHYNFPPYSTGEARALRGVGRREVGHGNLAERALLPVLPAADKFGYTIRVVSEIIASNGSTSMASVCGSTLSLMDAGVPIEAPVAGVAMGLILGAGATEGKHAVLTDIQGMEDALGDMDFKVAGTEGGITALQMDIKVKGITLAIMEEALEQAREARLLILGRMNEVISAPRTDLSKWAPKMIQIKLPTDKIGAVIGPGGKTIRKIQEDTGASIDIDDQGMANITSPNPEGAEQAAQVVRSIIEDVEVGKIYMGKITRLMAFGAFAEIMPGKEGLVHISELAETRVNRVEDVVEVGDEVMVMVIEVDGQGRVNLSRRAVIEGQTPDEVLARRPLGGGGPPSGGRPGGGMGGPRRDGPPRGSFGGSRGPRGPMGPR